MTITTDADAREMLDQLRLDAHLCEEGSVLDHAVDLAAYLMRRVEELGKDAALYQWLQAKARQDTAYDRYGNGGHWFIGFHSDNNSLSFDAAIQAEQEKGN